MRLLEKDLIQRSASATAVWKALQAVDLSHQPAGGTHDASQSTQKPVYRRAFVGRESEIRQLHQAFDTALSG